jgi:3-oxoadipate enol-lactonase
MIDWIDAGGISLRYELQGTARRTAVFVHEAGGCLESWEGVCEILQSDVRTLAYDSRGAGFSEKPVGAVTIDDFVRDLIALLDALRIAEPVTVVGCAVGAAVSMCLAARHAARVAGLVALAPATGIALADRARVLALAARIESEGVRSRVLERFDHSYALDYFTGRSDRDRVRARLLHADPTSYAQLYRMLCDLDLSADLPRIAVPTLVVAGRRDGTRPPDLVETVARAIPGARFEILDTGHAMNILSPGPVAAAIRTLLA